MSHQKSSPILRLLYPEPATIHTTCHDSHYLSWWFLPFFGSHFSKPIAKITDKRPCNLPPRSSPRAPGSPLRNQTASKRSKLLDQTRPTKNAQTQPVASKSQKEPRSAHPQTRSHHTGRIYRSPEASDGFKFPRMREEEWQDAKHQFVTMGVDYQPFGHPETYIARRR